MPAISLRDPQRMVSNVEQLIVRMVLVPDKGNILSKEKREKMINEMLKFDSSAKINMFPLVEDGKVCLIKSVMYTNLESTQKFVDIAAKYGVEFGVDNMILSVLFSVETMDFFNDDFLQFNVMDAFYSQGWSCEDYSGNYVTFTDNDEDEDEDEDYDIEEDEDEDDDDEEEDEDDEEEDRPRRRK